MTRYGIKKYVADGDLWDKKRNPGGREASRGDKAWTVRCKR